MAEESSANPSPAEGYREVVPDPARFAAAQDYLDALQASRRMLWRAVFPPQHAERLWRILIGPFTEDAGVPSTADWQEYLHERETALLQVEFGDDPTRHLLASIRIGRRQWTQDALASGADPGAPFFGVKTMSLFEKAIQIGDLGAVQEMLSSGVSASKALVGRDSPLRTAVRWLQPEIVELLCDLGADVDEWDAEGRTPLCTAADKSSVPMMRLLVARGASIDGAGRGDAMTPLQVAAHRNSPAAVKWLLDGGARPGVHERREGDPYLWRTLTLAVHDDGTLLELFLDLGVDANHVYAAEHDRTLLVHCARRALRRPTESLLRRGADPMIEDGNGLNAFQIAGECLWDRAPTQGDEFEAWMKSVYASLA